MNSTQLKLLALILMLIDHIAKFISGIPVYFHWLGRISAPIFFFCMVWGFYYTHDRKKYLLRLYLFGVFMGIMNFILNNFIQNPYKTIINNIFVTLFLSCLIIWLIEYRRENKKKGTIYMLLFLLFQVLSTLVIALFSINFNAFIDITSAISAILPNILFTEGSFIFVILGVLLYFNKEGKKRIILAYGGFCLVYFGLTLFPIQEFSSYFLINYQWMMIFSLPFMLLYNKEKGKGFKYLFYIFYPAHIIILYFLGNFLFFKL